MSHEQGTTFSKHIATLLALHLALVSTIYPTIFAEDIHNESNKNFTSKSASTFIEVSNASDGVDVNGYIVYCPCMGRFGNQADQFLGALAFAKSVNRTLVLPAWVEYIPYKTGSIQVPFDKYFKPEAILPYHKVITMERFMTELAPKVWPPEKRFSFCYIQRGNGKGCDAKDGNPFGPFWDNYKVDFVGSEIFGPELHYLAIYKGNGKLSWQEKYPGDTWPVLAFVGPPSGFPVESTNVHLQEYLVWQDDIEKKSRDFISSLPKGPFIGIHLRNGADWSRACELVDGTQTHLFSSPQCLGYHQENGKLTAEMCYPSTSTIIKQLKRAVKKINATSIFVASDRNHLITDLNTALQNLNVVVRKLPYDSPHVDLAVLGRSNLFIGNCVSSFSAFVKRSRDVHGFASEFWGYPPDLRRIKNEIRQNELDHDEL
ncbi:GDP-fucose protein O-fucosyltransferase 1 [Orchesella cincta]|uniref:GDP-fucose protein O-fucosyltransferase 1 n=1 Tax=Orchesella cincta TaxID=48709 RepID=A0A1D2MWH3_ORCCI|nr:GDP-fucose protein O-fucosyltransferase 1 [Orchesella cincta]